MSDREQVLQIVNEMPDYKVSGLLGLLRAFLFDNEEVPNAETVAAMQEVNEMIRTGSGERWQGSTADLFEAILAEDD
jgi:hypothetical protein